MLFTPEAHEPLAGEPWDADAARAAITAVVSDAESGFDGDGWPKHPRDHIEGEPPRLPWVYDGGAGVVDALRRLARQGYGQLRHDYVPYLERSLDGPLDFPDTASSLSGGETGIRLVLQRLAPSRANLERLAELIAAHVHDESRELMFGSAGTILAGRELGLDVTPSVVWLREQREADGLWTQVLFGRSSRCLGPAHGFAGCALALDLDASDVSATLQPFAVEDDGLVNWLPYAGMERLESPRDGQIRMQWCHGAPGIVATIGQLLDEELAVGGGELTWRAGPLTKGAGLCHGTAGNGYAFLTLLALTGDELWLERARAFAMHALVQLEHAHSEDGRGRYSLWTGDLGVALYLADCIDGGGELPLP